MKPQLVDTTKTKATLAEMTHGLVFGWYKAFATFPKKESLATLYSQWALETGSGEHCYNWNLGNAKSPDVNVDQPTQTYYCKLKGVWEIINGTKVILDIENPGSWFRAFKSLEDGVAFYLNFLRYQRYSSSWSAVETGNPAAFAHLLKLKHYYTAPEEDYIKGLNLYFNQFMKTNEFEKALAEFKLSLTPISDSNLPTEKIEIPKPLDSDDQVTELNIPIVWASDEKPSDEDSQAPEIKMTFWQKIKNLLPK